MEGDDLPLVHEASWSSRMAELENRLGKEKHEEKTVLPPWFILTYIKSLVLFWSYLVGLLCFLFSLWGP